jgi:hypothetical protein
MTTPQLWPIFICYRRVDGTVAARRLHEMLDKWRTIGPDEQPIQIDAYLDETMPGIADWKAMHRPYLEKARAIVVVCTPGAKLNEGPDDWVHHEIDWWIAHRATAPILVDPLKEGLRYVPLQIAARWPDIQRIPLVEDEWTHLSGASLEQKTTALRRQIIGAILPSGAAIYAQELAAERERADRLQRALAIAQAALLDTRAANLFGESRLIDARRELEMNRRSDLVERLVSARKAAARQGNLRHELQQLDADVAALQAASKEALTSGREALRQADLAWSGVTDERPVDVARRRPDPPYILSVELVNAGHGESILLHYGTPDDTRLVMINAGPGAAYRSGVGARLRQLSAARFGDRPVPIELFIVGDRDEDKTGGLERLLSGLAETASDEGCAVELRAIWANIFRVDGQRKNFRSHIRELISDLRIPLNEPFDRHVMRPEHGRVVVTIPGGLEIIVLGPGEERLAALYQLSAREAEQIGGTIEPLLPETFRHVPIVTDPAPLTVAGGRGEPPSGCRPSENARRLAGGSYTDQSVANLASTIVLFRFMGRTFLFTGDARGDLILYGLLQAGLLDEQGEAIVDLMTIPHLGSQRNITVDFFRRVKAAGYLFSGDGRHDNPSTTTVASLVAARECDVYRMYFVNRDGTAPAPDARHSRRHPASTIHEGPDDEGSDTHGSRLDTFFRRELHFNPNYRRVFRSSTSGSVIIDLLHPVRY